MKLKIFITIIRPRVDTGDYTGGVRISVHLSKRDALLDLCEWAYDDQAEDAGHVPDFPNAPEDELETYLERCQDEDVMRSWGIEESEIELPGTAAEQIAAILKDNCGKGDELHAEEIMREARGQVIREWDAEPDDEEEDCTCSERSWYGPEHDTACPYAGQPRETRTAMEEAIAHYTVVCKMTTEELAKKIEGLTGVRVNPEAEDLLRRLTDEQVAQVAKACEVPNV